jgi:hypothetical protein
MTGLLLVVVMARPALAAGPVKETRRPTMKLHYFGRQMKAARTSAGRGFMSISAQRPSLGLLGFEAARRLHGTQPDWPQSRDST